MLDQYQIFYILDLDYIVNLKAKPTGSMGGKGEIVNTLYLGYIRNYQHLMLGQHQLVHSLHLFYVFHDQRTVLCKYKTLNSLCLSHISNYKHAMLS